MGHGSRGKKSPKPCQIRQFHVLGRRGSDHVRFEQVAGRVDRSASRDQFILYINALGDKRETLFLFAFAPLIGRQREEKFK